jgi:hypothetical protein
MGVWLAPHCPRGRNVAQRMRSWHVGDVVDYWCIVGADIYHPVSGSGRITRMWLPRRALSYFLKKTWSGAMGLRVGSGRSFFSTITCIYCPGVFRRFGSRWPFTTLDLVQSSFVKFCDLNSARHGGYWVSQKSSVSLETFVEV